jgi:metabolite-proton symporter
MSNTSTSTDASGNTGMHKVNTPARVLGASLIGTTIEFFDFYVYATAAVLVFPALFFPNNDPVSALLASFATFSIAFFARPLGAIVFGHFGDKIGRKATLIAALLTMGISTVLIGLLPTYAQIGVAAPILLALCRFGQGLGLGGEWGGAVLLATENAPKGKKSWYGMFPQLGAPIGLFLSSGMFWILLHFMPMESLLAWGWRIPFVASLALIIVGLWVRLAVTETPEFQQAIKHKTRVKLPIVTLLQDHKRDLLLGTFMTLVTFVLIYLCAAYLLSYNTKVRGMDMLDALKIQIYGSAIFGLGIPIAGKLAEKTSRYTVLIIVTILVGLFSFTMEPLLTGSLGAVYVFTTIGMLLEGATYGVIGASLATAFPTEVRYTGSSITFNLGGIFGASLAPYAATWLQANYGVAYIGYYLLATSVITLLCIIGMGPKKV